MLKNNKPIPETQMELFKEIWKEREHKSQVHINGEEQDIFFDPWCFAHVLGKGPYPAFKLKKENIVLMTPAQHDLFDNRTHLAKKMSDFDWIFKLREKLIREYYAIKRT